ncbi:putative uncharacterized protein [Prevotella sp. CAG:520]|nr:putative uncharacterized protein [Prevotella sp. CAG:520]
MADGPNTNSGSKVASALNSIPFGNIIGGPLAACVRAQAEAAQTTIDFIRGFTMTNSELDPEGVEPITVTFTFIMNGEKTRMTVPLMTIVPIPYMHIDYVNLNFTADITACDDGKMEAKYATEGYTRTEDDEQSVSVESKMGINVRASTSSMPSGMAKMLEFFTNNLIVHDTLTPQQVEDMKREAERKRLELKNKKERMVGALVNALAEYKKQETERKEQRRNEELERLEKQRKDEEFRKKEEERLEKMRIEAELQKKQEQERLEKLQKEEEEKKKQEQEKIEIQLIEKEEQKKRAEQEREWYKKIDPKKRVRFANRMSRMHINPYSPFALPSTKRGNPHPECTFDSTQSISWNIARQEQLLRYATKKDWMRMHLLLALRTAKKIYPYDIKSRQAKSILEYELKYFQPRYAGWYGHGEPFNNNLPNGYRKYGAIDTVFTEFVGYVLENERKRNK